MEVCRLNRSFRVINTKRSFKLVDKRLHRSFGLVALYNLIPELFAPLFQPM